MQEASSSSSPYSRFEEGSTRSFQDGSSDEEEMDWEEVDVQTAHPPVPDNGDTATLLDQVGPSKTIEITLDTVKKRPHAPKKVGISHAERVMRLETHKIHTVALISNGWIRNKYLNDRLLHARLMSLTPLALQTAFTQIHKKREPNVARRGRLFEAAMMRLTQWWTENFFEVEPRGSGEVQSRTFEEVAAKLREKNDNPEEDDEEYEVIRSCKSLQKHALLRHGSRDVSAQLFTALCRALGVPARLVVSLQSVPWKVGVGKPKPVYKSGDAKGKRKEKQGEGETEQDEEDDGMEEVDISSPALDLKGKGKAVFPGDGQALNGKKAPPVAKGKEKAKPIIKLRKQRPKGRTLGSTKRNPGPPLGGYPPAQWTEVFSRPDGRWLPVDPVRNFVDKRKLFEPPPHDKRNRMVYVLAFEEDGWIRDVTQRYAREFTNKTSKTRVGGKGKKEWWDKVLGFLTRPYCLHRDDLEDEELQSRQVMEGMPTSMAAFKDHPIYVLERHLHRDEILRPRVEIGRFRGEPVFARANVVSNLKTAENWMRGGRVVSEGEQPMKWVKVRASTVGRQRALGIAGEDSHALGGEQGQGGMQGLYAESQTELYHPPPVVNGKVPKNDFGNIDLYVDTMLPTGAVHIPYKGTAKIARELGFDYAEAVTGFEFKSRRAFPVISGVVVAAENESALLEAYWASEQDAEEKERIKREERVLKRWTRLVQGLRIRKRLQEQYASQPPDTQAQHGVDNREDMLEPEAGGFLLETADSVVQAYTLPKPLHVIDPSSHNATIPSEQEDALMFDPQTADDTQAEDADNVDMEEIVNVTNAEPRVGAPKTMQQLAEANAEELAGASIEPTASEPTAASGNLRVVRASRKANGKTKQATAGRRSTRGRKRTRETSGSSDDEDDEIEERPKREKVATPTPVAPARTLRARIPKSEEKIRKEREMEQAFRRAIAE